MGMKQIVLYIMRKILKHMNTHIITRARDITSRFLQENGDLLTGCGGLNLPPAGRFLVTCRLTSCL